MKQNCLKNINVFCGLKIAIKNIRKNEQIIVLVNKRGYAPFVYVGLVGMFISATIARLVCLS